MWKEWKFLATTVKRYSALEKKCMITFQNITHSNDVLCRTERSMEQLVFFLFFISVLGPDEPCNTCKCCDIGNFGM